MNTALAPFGHDHAFVEMMKCFEELSLRERLKRTLRGLNQPKDSGDYKFAVLQIQRMTGPFLAVALPMLAIALLLGIEPEERVAYRVRPVEYIVVEPPPAILRIAGTARCGVDIDGRVRLQFNGDMETRKEINR